MIQFERGKLYRVTDVDGKTSDLVRIIGNLPEPGELCECEFDTEQTYELKVGDIFMFLQIENSVDYALDTFSYVIVLFQEHIWTTNHNITGFLYSVTLERIS